MPLGQCHDVGVVVQGERRGGQFGEVRPEFDAVEHRHALVHGWHRALRMRSRVNRGTPDQPGLAWMVTQLLEALDSGRFSSAPPK